MATPNDSTFYDNLKNAAQAVTDALTELEQNPHSGRIDEVRRLLTVAEDHLGKMIPDGMFSQLSDGADDMIETYRRLKAQHDIFIERNGPSA